MHVSLRVAAVLSALIPYSANATPIGTPPPPRYAISRAWQNCDGPVTITMQGTALAYLERAVTPNATSKFTKGQRVRVLASAVLVIQPGLGVMLAPFENGPPDLSPGDGVYVLGEWELDYFHAWYGGKEADGGLPIGDSRAFRMTRAPVVERWVKVELQNSRRPLWAKDADAFMDWKAIQACTQLK